MVPGGFFAKLKMRRVARLYAARLPRRLAQDYGAGETYSDAQIAACARRVKLPEAGLRLARAAYLPEHEFLQKYGAGQAALRALFRENLPRVVFAQHVCGTTDANNVSYVGGTSI